MKSGYMEFAFLALSLVLLANIALCDVWNYSDVDLRIAERKVIPHYRRHSYEYPDIDFKKIMQQRGIPIPPQNHAPLYSTPNYNTVTYVNPLENAIHQVPWRSHGKSVALSNHIVPHQDVYFKKKNKYYRDIVADRLIMKSKFY